MGTNKTRSRIDVVEYTIQSTLLEVRLCLENWLLVELSLRTSGSIKEDRRCVRKVRPI
jgi:hypothetical protein